MCRRRQGPQLGFVYLGQAKGDEQFALYRLEGDPKLREREEQYQRGRQHRYGGNGSTGKPLKSSQRTPGGTPSNDKPPPDWLAQARQYAAALTSDRRAELARVLGLPEATLALLPDLGFSLKALHKSKREPCWTFPEVDSAGGVVGLLARYLDGAKKALAGGKRGLTLVDGWSTRDGPAFCVEGPSDTLTLAALGLAGVGRPSNTGGVELLAELLRALPAARPIIVLGEYDPKPNGDWPGRDGAAKVAVALEAALGRPVSWSMPPGTAKDSRAWFRAQAPDLTCADAVQELGQRFLAEVLNKQRPSQPGTEYHMHRQPGEGLVTTCLATVRPEPVRFLVHGYIPLGKLVLFAGDGGHGKSALTLHLAACITQGRCCFGLKYEPLARAEVLLVSCEDDMADTVVPRLLAGGADLGRIFHVRGSKGKDGNITPFSLAEYQQMEEELRRRPDVRLVVIDPAGAYVGRTGVDDHKDSELRSLLDPMAELAARRRVTIGLVKHLNKGATAKAVYKVSGGAGYVNAVRAAYVIAPDIEDPDKKLFLPIKYNLGLWPDGLAYRLEPLADDERDGILREYGGHLQAEDQQHLALQLFYLEWLGKVDADPDRLFSDLSRRDRGPRKVQQASEWLKQFLATYAYPSDEILAAARKEDFTFDNVKEAKVVLKAEGLRSSNRGRFQGDWWSGFGDPDIWQLRPEPRESDAPGAPHTPQSPHNGKDPSPARTSGNPVAPHNVHCGEPGQPLRPMTEPNDWQETSGLNPSIVGRLGSVGSAGEQGDEDAGVF
jgi:hypothetical protein